MADDLLQMQRQAARRVQQMQQHSRQVFEAHCQPTDVPPPCAPERGRDNDRLLILGLVALLYQSGGRPELILALLYLLM